MSAERVALALLLALLVTAPLFLGSVPGFDTTDPEPGSWLAFFQALGPWYLFVSLGLLLAVFVVCTGARPEREVRWPLLLLGGLALFAAIQCVPLPRFVGALLAPAATEHREALGLEGWAPISWDIFATGREIGRIIAHLAIVAAVAMLVRSRKSRWILAGAVVAVAGLDALYGLIEHFLLEDRVLGFGKLTGMGKVTGTFINKNHLAALMEIAIPLAGAILFFRMRLGKAEGRRPGGVEALLGLALLAMIAAAILTLSRAAYVATFAGIFVLLFLVVFGRTGKAGKATTIIFIVLMGAVALLILQVFEPLSTRFGHGVSDKGFFDIRFPAWESTLEMAADQPVLGTGMGTFGSAIHAYQSPLVPHELHYAHNDYLNLLSDGGIVGLALGALFAFFVIRIALRRLRGPEGQARTFAVAALAGALGVGLHSLFEFNFQIPGVTVSLAVMTGLVLGAVGTGNRRSPTTSWRPFRLALCSVVFPGLLALSILPMTQAQLMSSRAKGYLERGEAWWACACAEKGNDFLTEGRAWFLRAQDEEDHPKAIEKARERLERAAESRPLRFEPWFRLGEVAMFEKRWDAVREAFGRARRFTRGMAEPNYAIGGTLMIIGLQTKDPDFIADGADAVREAGAIEADLHGKAFDQLGPFVKDIETLRRMSPDTAYGHGRLVGLLRKLGRDDEAIEELRILEKLDPTANNAYALADLLLRTGRHDEAAAPLRRYLDRKGLTEKTLDDIYRVYVLGKKRGPALAFFEELTDGPARRMAHAHFHRARLESDLGRYDDARKSIREAVRLAPKDERYLRKQRAIVANSAAD